MPELTICERTYARLVETGDPICPDCSHSRLMHSGAQRAAGCVVCEKRHDRLEPLARLLEQAAETARTSPYGRHPDVETMTHAAAFMHAAELVRGYGQ